MRRLVIAILFLCLARGLVPGRLAVVASADGELHRGHVRLEEQELILVNAAQDVRLQMAATNLGWVVFESAPSTPVVEANPASSAPWLEKDIGSMPIPGSTRQEGEVFTVRSSGLDLDGYSDSFHYVYKPVQGDREIIVHVSALHQTSPNAKAGVMMRENLGEYSRCVMLGLTPVRGGFLQFRDEEGRDMQVQSRNNLRAPCWIKLRREGHEFSAYQSRNGCQWEPAGSVTLPMSGSFYVGIATTSARDRVVNWSTFRQVQEGVHLRNPAFPPRAELVSGSVVVGWPVPAQETEALDIESGFTSVTVPLRAISRMMFQWVPIDPVVASHYERTGVWLANGEFLEGDLRAVEDGKVRISSVLYGQRSFDASSEVVLVALQKRESRPARYEVKTVTGSVWRAQSIAFKDNELIFKEPVLGEMNLPIHQIAAIRQP